MLGGRRELLQATADPQRGELLLHAVLRQALRQRAEIDLSISRSRGVAENVLTLALIFERPLGQQQTLCYGSSLSPILPWTPPIGGCFRLSHRSLRGSK